MTRFILLAGFLLCICLSRLNAQVRLSVYAGAGSSYASATRDHISNEFTVRPHFGLFLNIPVWKNIAIETGSSYTIKGFINKDTLWDDSHPDNFWVSRIGNRLGYLAFPLIFSYRFKLAKHHTLYAGAGMVYGFMVHGVTKGKIDVYRKGELTSEHEIDLPVQTALIPSSDNSNTKIYMFDTGLKLQCSYVWRDRFGIRLFHEQSLYSYNTSGESKSETRLRFTGIALSFGLLKL